MNKVNLSRLKKCPQRWERMNTVPGGRLCQKCRKTIVDLRKSSPDEIAQMHIQHKDSLCGLYTQKQLENTDGYSSAIGKNFAFLGISILPLISAAQSPDIERPKTEQRAKDLKSNDQFIKSENDIRQDSVYFSGRVFEKHSDGSTEPIPFATIQIPELDTTFTTDFNGNFEINISQFEEVPDSVSLMVQFIGYARKNFWNVPTNQSKVFQVELAEQQVVAFGVTIREPAPKRLWHKFKNLFRKKENRN